LDRQYKQPMLRNIPQREKCRLTANDLYLRFCHRRFLIHRGHEHTRTGNWSEGFRFTRVTPNPNPALGAYGEIPGIYLDAWGESRRRDPVGRLRRRPARHITTTNNLKHITALFLRVHFFDRQWKQPKSRNIEPWKNCRLIASALPMSTLQSHFHNQQFETHNSPFLQCLLLWQAVKIADVAKHEAAR